MEDVEEFGRGAGVGYEEYRIILLLSVSQFHSPLPPSNTGRDTYRSQIPQIPMQRLTRMQKTTPQPETLHTRHHLLPHEPALPHSTHQQFPACLIRLCDCLDGAQETVAGYMVALVQDCDLAQCGRGGGEDTNGAAEELLAIGVVVRKRGREQHGARAAALERL